LVHSTMNRPRKQPDDVNAVGISVLFAPYPGL